MALSSSSAYTSPQKPQKQKPPRPAAQDTFVSVLAGAAAGACSACVANPLDTLRVRLAASREATGQQHKSLLSHLKLLFSGGVREAFGKGLMVNIMAASPSNAVYYASYKEIHAQLTHLNDAYSRSSNRDGPEGIATVDNSEIEHGNWNGRNAMKNNNSGENGGGNRSVISPHFIPFLAATGAVALAQGLLSPLFVVRTRVQIDPSQTASQYFRTILKDGGVRGFYRGAGTNVAGRGVEEGVFWYVYEQLKRITSQGQLLVSAEEPTKKLSGEKGESSSSGESVNSNDDQGERQAPHHILNDGLSKFIIASGGVLGLSGFAKLIGTSISYPYNVVMIHQRGVDKATGKHLHTKFIPTLRHVYRHDGFIGFYKGLSPHLLRSVISKATQIYVFELVLSLYEARKFSSSVE